VGWPTGSPQQELSANFCFGVLIFESTFRKEDCVFIKLKKNITKNLKIIESIVSPRL
jgi:hypothetical protein